MASRAAYDSLIREIYLSGSKGPLRLIVGPGGYPPFLAAGETAWLDRRGVDGAVPGELLGVRSGSGDVRLLRFLERSGERVRVLTPARVDEAAVNDVVGRVVEVTRGGKREPVDAREGTLRLRAAEARARLRQGLRRVRLQKTLSGIYWELVDRFEQGVSETGDLLITERCPVGCRFCIYSCVAAGQDMSEDVVRRAASAFRTAGVPLVRLLGGEPFLSVPLLLRSFRAVRESYPPEAIIVLTSGYFGTSAELTRAKMDPLIAEGLKKVHLSFDSFHLERYPLACYERVLDYCAEHDLEAAMVIHYSDALDPELPRLVELHRRYPFPVRLATVSREGDAAALGAHETSVQGFEAFREALLAVPGLRLIPEERSCFRWTVFPPGDVSFCCKEGDKNRAGNLAREEFGAIQSRLRERTAHNRLNVLRFATSPSGELTGNPCLSCPLDAGLGGQSHQG